MLQPLPLPLLLAASLQAAPGADPAPASPTAVEEPLARVAIALAGPDAATFEDLRRLDLDLIELSPDEGRAVILARPAELAALRAGGFAFEVENTDEQARYAARLADGPTAAALGAPALGASLTPPFGQGSMGGYYTLAEVESVLDQLAAAHPGIVSPKVQIGQSVQGRPIWAVKVSDQVAVDEDEPEVRYDSLHHSREPQGMQTALWFLLFCVENYGSEPLATYLVDERELWFVPVVNPDGYVYNQQIAPNGGGLWRKNRRNNGGGSVGVDLNRNYPYQWGFDFLGSSGNPDSEVYRGPSPASEPETQAMIAFIEQRDFRTALSIHTFSDLWLQPYGYDLVFPANQSEYDELNDLCVEENGYLAGSPPEILYPANGGTIDWEANLTGAFSWTPEIGGSSDGFWPDTDRIVPLAEENLLAFQRVALAAGAFVYVDGVELTAVGDGDGFAEPDETVELVVDVRNAGRDATGGPVTATLVLESSDASIVAGQADLGVVGPFQGADNAAAPLVLALPGDLAPGTTVDWRVVLSYEGYDQDLSGSISVGEPRTLLADDLELDRGWTAGLPSDTASTGLWERGVPDGTTSGGQPANPGADTTPGGQFAYVTGNGGGSGGNDDVDDGRTTLVTPRIDLSGVDNARVSYERWFADLSVADDEFRIEASNDDGQSWVVLETISGNQNQWVRSEFDLGEVLSLSEAVRLRFVAEDDPNNSVVEAAVDDLALEVFAEGPLLAVYGTPEPGGTVRLFTSVEDAATVGTYFAAGTAELTLPGVEGTLLIDPATATLLSSAAVSPGPPTERTLALPSDPSLSGAAIPLQALAVSANGLALSNRLILALD